MHPERQRSSFCQSEDERGTVERKHTHSFHFISLSFSFSSSRSISVSLSCSLSLLIHMHTHAERYSLSHRSKERALENRRSWLAAERQRRLSVWTKPAKKKKKVCSPGEKSSREMPGSGSTCRDLKVGAHGKSAVEGRRKRGCHAANVGYQWSSVYQQRLLQWSVCGPACSECIISRRKARTKKGFWHMKQVSWHL